MTEELTYTTTFSYLLLGCNHFAVNFIGMFTSEIFIVSIVEFFPSFSSWPGFPEEFINSRIGFFNIFPRFYFNYLKEISVIMTPPVTYDFIADNVFILRK